MKTITIRKKDTTTQIIKGDDVEIDKHGNLVVYCLPQGKPSRISHMFSPDSFLEVFIDEA